MAVEKHSRSSLYKSVFSIFVRARQILLVTSHLDLELADESGIAEVQIGWDLQG